MKWQRKFLIRNMSTDNLNNRFNKLERRWIFPGRKKIITREMRYIKYILRQREDQNE